MIKGQRAFIPAWLTDREMVAPCVCGRPLYSGQSWIVEEGELGFKRWSHITCWQMTHGMEDFEGEE